MAEITLRTHAANLNIGVVSYRGDEYLESKGDSVGILNSKVLGYPFTNEISFMVVAGTTLGMMLANAPVVWLGDAITKRVPLRIVHLVSAGIFAILGTVALLGWG